MPGKLYIVATPIGNMGDITLRAIDVLKSVDTILCEDTRVTGKLLKLLKERNLLPTAHRPKLISYHQHSSELKKLQILKLLIEGNDLVLVTDAGTPGVSDPGNELIHYILDKEPLISIVPVPGPSSLTTAISVSGMHLSQFIFAGFLPKKRKGKLFTLVKSSKLPLVFLESPKRLQKTLKLLSDEFGPDRTIFVARELTKLHETHYRGTIAEVIETIGMGSVKGEIVVILNPN